MRCALDIDNVIAAIIDSALLVMAGDLGLDPAEISHTDIYWDPFTHADPALAARLKPTVEFWDREEVLAGCQPLPGALDAAWRLYNEGLLACYITRRPPTVDDITRTWIAVHGLPPVPVEHVGSSGDEDYFARCKSSVCARYGVTHMVDDHPGEADMLAKAGVEVVLVDAPIGRVARNDFLKSHPHLRLAPDLSAAVDLLIGDLKAAA
jgi:hypothetical protein